VLDRGLTRNVSPQSIIHLPRYKSAALKMEVARSSEKPTLTYDAARCKKPEEYRLVNICLENLKSYMQIDNVYVSDWPTVVCVFFRSIIYKLLLVMRCMILWRNVSASDDLRKELTFVFKRWTPKSVCV